MESSSTSGRRASHHDHRLGGLASHKAASEMNEPIRQLATHRGLVSGTEEWRVGASLPLDAVIVPASRPAWNLDQAITLARASHCALLILCSHRAKPAEIHELLAERSFDGAIVVDLPAGYGHEMFDFRALESIKDDLPAACFYYASDLSMKRNIGLVVARMLGWRRIFFFDDDIRDINAPDVHQTVAMLCSYHIAGMRVTNFPDNSVACHAHRMTRGRQDVFVTGAALAVDCQQKIGFFPNIYNEDWLFFYDDAARGRLGSSGHEVTQLRYDPFDDARRAEWQEFGDVLAEGLYALLDRGLGLKHATREYWHDFLRARQIFIDKIIERSEMATPEIKERLLLSVGQAQKCSIGIVPAVLEHYIRLWRRDLHDWEQRLAQVSQLRSPDTALRALDLVRSTERRSADLAGYYLTPQDQGPVSTVPFNAPDYYDLFQSGAQESRFRTSARRAFRNYDRADAPMEPSPEKATDEARI
jgi:hypothetical protein